MRIGIDARAITVNDRGISTYIFNLINSLAKIDGKNKFFIYINSKEGSSLDKKKIRDKLISIKKNPNFFIKDIRSKNDLIWEQILLPWRSFKDSLDVLHMTSNRTCLFASCKLISVVHDTLELDLYDSNYQKMKKMKGTSLWKALLFEGRLPWKYHQFYLMPYLKFTYKYLFKKNDLVIAISDKTKEDVLKKLKVKRRKVKMITHGIDNLFKKLPRSNKKYILTLGGTAHQKNPEGPLIAYSLLKEKYKKKYPLLILGASDIDIWKKLLEKYKIKNYILKGFVSKKELIRAYNEAKIFLFLSKIEGFGFPPLEAMACGTVPLVYDIDPMKSNVDNKELIVEAGVVKKVAEKMRQIIENRKLYNNLVSFGLKRSKDFSWEKCAKEYLSLYMSLK